MIDHKQLDHIIHSMYEDIDIFNFSIFTKKLKYHHGKHIIKMVEKLNKKYINCKNTDSNFKDYVSLKVAIYFHDIYQFNHYNCQNFCGTMFKYIGSNVGMDIHLDLPTDKSFILTDEVLSWRIFYNLYKRYCNRTETDYLKDLLPDIKDIILSQTQNKLVEEFEKLDFSILDSTDINELIEYENGIFYEYKNHDIVDYVKKRVEFLKRFVYKNNTINSLISYIKNRTYNIAVYPGSFDPFHKGHYSVVEKAEKVFDKVIILRLQNIDKEPAEHDLNNNWYIADKEKIIYDKTLIAFLFKLKRKAEEENIKIKLTVIRGIRNIKDVVNELEYYDNLNLVSENIELFFIPTNLKISSSLIRELIPHWGLDKVNSKFMNPFNLK